MFHHHPLPWNGRARHLGTGRSLQLIERAPTNVIDHAVRHAPGAGPVRVSLRREGLQALLLVEDAKARAAGGIGLGETGS